MGNPDELIQTYPQIDSNLNSRMRDQESFDELKQKSATIIDWNSQNITAFPDIKSICFPKKITHLYLNFNNIIKLPQGLPQILLNLHIFSLDGNELLKLPDDFGDFLSLEELYLSENKLTLLPNSLCHLSKLKVLKVCCNALRSLHPEIGQNTCLENLSVDENYLKRFPPTLGLLKNLKVLEANSNKLTSLPETAHFLENLQTVDLSKNRISNLPKSFSELKHLKHIDFSENQLVNLWETCQSSSSLEKIFLDTNSLITLPPWFSDLDRVSEISLNSNSLSTNSLPEGFGLNLSNLKSLDLRGNFIMELPDSFVALHALEILHLGTPFDYLEKRASFQNGNWLRQFPNSFGQLHNLVLLGAQENQLAFLPDSIGNLTNLKEIYLGANLLTFLPASFCSMHSLEKCQLSKNKIKLLPEDFGNLESLLELHLDQNKLKTLPSSMRRCMTLELLDLTDNRLSVVPNDILASLTNLKALNMNQNRFEVPYTDIPHIAKEAHYKELNPSLKDNWRGRNNRPYSTQDNHLHINEVVEKQLPYDSETESCGYENETSEDSDKKSPIWDSSEDEDWEKECDPPCSDGGTVQTPFDNVNGEEENWDSEVVRHPSQNHIPGFEAGQFDLDEDAFADKRLLNQPVAFDFYGNPSRRIDLDIFHHRMLPYVFHTTSHRPFVRDPYTVEDGQFEDTEG